MRNDRNSKDTCLSHGEEANATPPPIPGRTFSIRSAILQLERSRHYCSKSLSLAIIKKGWPVCLSICGLPYNATSSPDIKSPRTIACNTSRRIPRVIPYTRTRREFQQQYTMCLTTEDLWKCGHKTRTWKFCELGAASRSLCNNSERVLRTRHNICEACEKKKALRYMGTPFSKLQADR
jgi:hypothetical protein